MRQTQVSGHAFVSIPCSPFFWLCASPCSRTSSPQRMRPPNCALDCPLMLYTAIPLLWKLTFRQDTSWCSNCEKRLRDSGGAISLLYGRGTCILPSSRHRSPVQHVSTHTQNLFSYSGQFVCCIYMNDPASCIWSTLCFPCSTLRNHTSVGVYVGHRSPTLTLLLASSESPWESCSPAVHSEGRVHGGRNATPKNAALRRTQFRFSCIALTVQGTSAKDNYLFTGSHPIVRHTSLPIVR